MTAGIRELIETHRRSPKAKIIRQLYDVITEAMNEGITLDLLVDYLTQQELKITKGYLRNTLYRIRKKRGQIKTPLSLNKGKISISDKASNVKNEEAIDDWERLLSEYGNCSNQIDKYVVLGGNREDIEGKPISTQREMVTMLRTKLRRQYKGTY